MYKLIFDRIKRDKDTNTETIVRSEINIDEIQCLYQDQYGVYISTKQGYLIKVAHLLPELQEYLNL